MELTAYDLESVRLLQSAMSQIVENLGSRLTDITFDATLSNGDHVKIGYGTSGDPALLWARNGS